ncbi:hypothetical protein Pelo_18166 [Pelomyxa schiedti]|nr:hypothetical protein Pelo_18166 [Pelomyxa schiedti]
MLALATSWHPRCGASSPARLLQSQPAVLRQLWDSCGGLTDKRLITFGVSRELVGALAGSVSVSPAWCQPTSYWRDPPCCVYAAGSGIHVLEKNYSLNQEFAEFSMVLPSAIEENGRTPANKAMWRWGGETSQTADGMVNSKWWVVYCDMSRWLPSEVCISRISGSHGGERLGPSSGGTVCRLKVPFLMGFFLSKFDPDEAAMVTADHANGSLVISVIDVEATFSTGAAKLLSETKWLIYDYNCFVLSGMIFHHQTTGSRSFVIVTHSTMPDFEESEAFIVEESTSCQRKIDGYFREVSQLNESLFCVSLSAEYQLWEARVAREQPLRRVSICHHDVVTAECGLLFHRTQGNSVVNVTHAATGMLILSFTVPPKSATHISGFLL